MAAFNEKLLKSLLKMVPQSVIDGVPELIVGAIRQKLETVQHTGSTMPAIIILPDSSDARDCLIGVCSLPIDMDIDIAERYGGKEFVNKLIKEADNG